MLLMRHMYTNASAPEYQLRIHSAPKAAFFFSYLFNIAILCDHRIMRMKD